MSHLDSGKEELHRPSEQEIKSTWRAIYSDPLVSSSRLRTLAVSMQGLGEVHEDGGITLRSVYWRHYHDLLPSPTSLDTFPDALYSSRQSYTSLRRRYLLAPDGRWASDCSPPLDELDSPGAGPSRTTSPTREEGGKSWDPLSLESESPWKTWFAHQELRQTIRQDVDRTFPDIDYFTSERVRKCMVSILFLWSITNPDVGYRQGMHELLAVCFWVLDRDSLSPPDKDVLKSPLARDTMDDAMQITLDRRYVEHDAFGIYNEIMKSAKPFYEWRAEEVPRSATNPSQAPIITRCQHIHNNLIARIDPQLWERLETEGVEAQIWAIRWLRLIFTRELPFDSALRIWDGVFAEDPKLQLLDFICIAMLLLIRNELIEADYPTLLTNLLHYPAPSTTYPFDPSLTLSHAIFLRDNISPASGVEVVLQNQEMLGVKAQPPERERVEEPIRRGGPGRGAPIRGRPSMASPQGQGQGQAMGQRAGVQGFAQGWIDRAQAAGLDKAVLSAVSDLRRNLPDTSSAYSYLPNLPFSPLSPPTRDGQGQFSSIPTTSSALPHRQNQTNGPSTSTYFPRPVLSSTPSYSNPISPEVASLQAVIREQERQMAEIRLAMLGMGKAMSEYLASPLDQDSRNGLERVKDGLLGAGGRDLDELVKEWAWHEGLERSDLSGDGVISTTRSPDLPPKADISSNGVANLRSDQTPTLSTPTSTFDSTLASRKPPLVLSSRTDTGPLASLPRTPQTPRSAHPPSERLATHNRPFEPLGHPATGSLRQSEMTTTTAQKPPTTSGDPLGVGP